MKLYNPALPVVLVDDDQRTLDTFSLMLKSAGIENVLTVADSRTAQECIAGRGASVVVLDLLMPHLTGSELLPRIKQTNPEVPVIIMTATNDIDSAIECMKKGAVDYLVKPVEQSRFLSSVQTALEIGGLRDEVNALKGYLLSGKLKNKDAFAPIITRSPRMFALFQYIEAVAASPQPLLITGETGTGKELIAQVAHGLSGKGGGFAAVNAAGLDDTLFSDTLFGHEKGAFTGADTRRQGMITQAEGGTLFLDEIGELSEPSQVKLLRLLQDGIYYPLGTDIAKRSGARIIAATNTDPRELMAAGKFRKDLYYRLCTHHICLPPLRERSEDIPLLVAHFLDEAAASMQKNRPTPPPELFTLLSAYPFPGNVRELRAMVFDAVARHRSGVLSMASFKHSMKHLPPLLQPLSSSSNGAMQLYFSFSRFPTLDEVDDYFVQEALKRTNGNISLAASLLGISRQALSKRRKKESK
ncbi:MAG: sigma-54 dependent transcriptional regulator [Nitrospirota bacterium]|nr:sigma-54 dependent transcriptional regulator [Nitrospirota bacterium]